MQPNLAKAIIAVTAQVKGIEKSMTIGTGSSSYKGVSDQIVKQVIGDAMVKNGLCIVPVSVDAKIQVDRWEESTQYGVKQKQSVFTETNTRYLLMHESGESIEIAGYGHGVDSQDKSAGKATTYALKYALLYTFLVPTGKIDDAEYYHSDTIETPQKSVNNLAALKADLDKEKVKAKEVFNKGHKNWKDGVAMLKEGTAHISQFERKYFLTEENREALLSEAAI